MKRKAAFIVILALLVGLLLNLIWWIAIRSNNQKKFEELMNLGNKYLLEENYEEAIIAFNKAIEIDSRSVESYSKLAVAYTETGDYGQAILILEKGIAITENEQLKVQAATTQSIVNVMEELVKLFEQGDRDTIWQFMSEDLYQNMIVDLQQVLKFYCQDEKYLLIYPCGHSYYGDWVNRKREGYGIWAECSFADEEEGRYSFFQGEWAEDYPNGYGEFWDRYVDEKVGWITYAIKGTYKDGYEHGDMSQESSDYPGVVLHYHVENGIPDILEEETGDMYMFASDPDVGSMSIEKGLRLNLRCAYKDNHAEDESIQEESGD